MPRRPPLAYAGGHLDRADARRKDPAWVADAFRHPDARLVPMWRDAQLVLDAAGEAGAPSAALVPVDALVDGETDAGTVERDAVFLGLDDERPLFAVEVHDAARDDVAARAGGTFVDLRRVGPLLEEHDAAMLAYARGMLLWHRRHRHCGVCGSPTEARDGGHLRVCTHLGCGAESHPRTDPAVIMLIEHRPADGPPRCLLARSGRFPPRAYSTLAGFVEPGESLEEAVAREAYEEAGVRIVSATYQGSQPWPFPASLMIGFRAIAGSPALALDAQELEDARWFTAGEVLAFGEWGDETAALRLPRRDSIARSLIESWVRDVMGERAEHRE